MPYHKEYYGQLVGKTVKEIRTNTEYDDYYKFYDIVFTDGTYATVLSDVEGNGPGYLEIGDDCSEGY